MVKITPIAMLITSALAIQRVSADEVHLATVDYHLNEREISSLSDEAMSGSPDAALKLANFYWIRNNPKISDAKHWAIIGAENGSAEAQLRAFQTMRFSRKNLDQVRSLFWLRKAADQNNQVAAAILSVCQSIDAKAGRHDKPCFGPGSEK